MGYGLFFFFCFLLSLTAPAREHGVAVVRDRGRRVAGVQARDRSSKIRRGRHVLYRGVHRFW